MKFFPVLDKTEFKTFLSRLEVKILMGEVFRVETSDSDYFYFSADEFILGEKYRELKIDVNYFFWPKNVVTHFDNYRDKSLHLSRSQKYQLWKLLIRVWASFVRTAMVPRMDYV